MLNDRLNLFLNILIPYFNDFFFSFSLKKKTQKNCILKDDKVNTLNDGS